MFSFKLFLHVLLSNFLVKVQSELLHAGDYTYDESQLNGPTNWNRVNSNCNGSFQSPINFNEQLGIPVRLSLVVGNFHLKPSEVVMTNDGQTVELVFSYPNFQRATITGPVVNNELYTVHSVHFHWGENDAVGSEHTINSRSYPGEMHIVSYNSKYGSVAQARKVSNGLAVIGTFFTVDERRIPTDLLRIYHMQKNSPGFMALNNYLTFLPRLVDANSKISLVGENAVSLLEIIKQIPFSYFTYKGSLTTPDCEESVIWIVNRLPVLVSSEVFRNLRSLKDRRGVNITRNYRPTQELNGRRIFRFN